MNRQLNVGVIGLGRLGGLYARYFLGRISGAKLVAVADINEELAASFAGQNNVQRWHTDYRELLANEEIDAVVVVTTTQAHKEIVVEAARAGKPTFCEKPLSLSIDEALDMKAIIEQTGSFFQLGFMRRFDNGYAAARRSIETGSIGTPIVFKSSSRDPYRPSLEYLDPNNSGGLFTDCGIHDVDLARWLIGEIASVYSIGGVLAYPEMQEIGDVDNAIVTLQFAGGQVGVIDLSRSGIYGYDIRTEILGTKGTLKIGYLRETPLMILTKDGVTHDTVPYFMERFGQAYVTQLQDFVDNVRNDKPAPITCDEGIAALRVTLAATRSLKENRPVAVE
jgi:scyllo-inositol 2-dehydrogenase (NAD+)